MNVREHISRVVALLALLISSAAFSTELVSRYGSVTAMASPTNAGSFSIAFDKKPLITIEADDVSLYKVTASKDSKIETVIIEKTLPGLNCHNEYMLVTIFPDKKTALSPSFGGCLELDRASNIHEGVKIKLRSPAIAGAPKPHFESYIWDGAKLIKR